MFKEFAEYDLEQEDEETAALHDRHLWGIGRFRSHKQTEPIELDGTLAGICRLFDEMLARMKNVESGLIGFETMSDEEDD